MIFDFLEGITALKISPDGKTLFSGSQDMAIRVWDLTIKKCIKTFANAHVSDVQKFELTRDNLFLLSKSNNSIKLWRLENMRYVCEYRNVIKGKEIRM